MRGEPKQALALTQRFAHEAELGMLEITQAAVYQAGRCGTRAGTDVALIEQQDAQAAQGRFTRDRGTVDAGTDDDQVIVSCVGRNPSP